MVFSNIYRRHAKCFVTYALVCLLLLKDLREKNWKAMDALSTTEANSKKKVKDIEEAVFVSNSLTGILLLLRIKTYRSMLWDNNQLSVDPIGSLKVTIVI